MAACGLASMDADLAHGRNRALCGAWLFASDKLVPLMYAFAGPSLLRPLHFLWRASCL